MRRNQAPAVTLTNQQREILDENVLTVIRGSGALGLRMSEILADGRIRHVIAGLPGRKPDHRYVGESTKRLKGAGKVEFVRGVAGPSGRRGRWRTTSPTA